MSTFAELIEIMRVDYLSDVFDDWELSTEAERNQNFLWKDSTLLRHLNYAQRQACQRADITVEDREFQIRVVANKREYAVDSLVAQLNNVTLNTSPATQLVKTTRVDLNNKFSDFRNSTGVPTHYYMKGYNLFLYPTPVVPGTLTLETNAFPEIAISTDEPIIPSTQHIDLIWYALSQAYSMQDADTYDKTRIDFYMDKFIQAFGIPVSNAVIMHQLENKGCDNYIGGVDYLKNSNTDYRVNW